MFSPRRDSVVLHLLCQTLRNPYAATSHGLKQVHQNDPAYFAGDYLTSN
jgi:hypothetical protein